MNIPVKATFGALMRESVLTTGVIALLFCGTACYMFATGQEVPGVLQNFVFITLAFFFGVKRAKRIDN